MKSKKIQFLEKILRLMALAVLLKYKPKVVGITGSVGKTSAKEAIFAVLGAKLKVRKNEKNYNNEIGIPLTVIGVETGGRSLLKWLSIFLRWIGMLIFPVKYPEVLILEMGVDRPGDMTYLLSFLKPMVAVVTNISSSHIEFFKSLDNIAKEKGGLVESLPKNGFAILNADDERAIKLSQRTEALAITFGFSEQANVNAEHFNYHYREGIPEGISFKLSYDGTSMPIRINGMLAKHQINAALAGVAVGIAFKINLVDIAAAMENFSSAPGRLNLIKGIKDSFLIDDTYNASPTSTIAALGVLAEIEGMRKLAILGDMLELGEEESDGHESVVQKAVDMNIDLLFAVGRRMAKAVEKMVAVGFPKEKVFTFDGPGQVAEKIEQYIQAGDIILVKGSQGMRMEKIVYELMENKQDAEKMICRQSTDWQAIPFGRP